MDTQKVIDLIKVLRKTLSSSANNDSDNAGELVNALMQVVNDEIPTQHPVYVDTPNLGTRELIHIRIPDGGANKLTPAAGMGKFAEIIGTKEEYDGVKTLILYGPTNVSEQWYSHDPEYQNIEKVIQDFEAGKIRVLVDETDSQYKVYQVIGSEHDMGYMWYINSNNEGQTECRLVKSVVYQNNQ